MRALSDSTRGRLQGKSHASNYGQLALFEPATPTLTYAERLLDHGPLRRCGGCNRMLPVSCYPPAASGRDGLCNSCPDCSLRNARIHRGVHPADARSRPTPLDRCAICCSDGGPRGLFLDHDHESGRFRGWLCHPCNAAIGHLRDDPALCIAAAAYLDTSLGAIA